MLAESTSSLMAPVINTALANPTAMVDLASRVAPFASIILYLAPLPTIRQISRDRHVGDLPLLPYSSMAISGFLWSTYGILKNQASVWSSNGTGMLLAIFYSLQFSRFAPKASPTLPGSLKQHRNGALLIAVTALAAAFTQSTKLVGLMCVGICLALFGSPLAALKTVVANKSAASIPLPMSLATTFNCFLWSVVGIFKFKDLNVSIPNGIGFLLGMVQLSLKAFYGNGRMKPAPVAVASSTLTEINFEENELLQQNIAFVGQYDVNRHELHQHDALPTEDEETAVAVSERKQEVGNLRQRQAAY